MRASASVSPVDKPREEKKEKSDFQVTVDAIRSTPLLMKWPLSFNVAGSSPKARAMDPRSSLWSSQVTNGTAIDRDGQKSLTILFLSPDISLSKKMKNLFYVYAN
ncbi:hypothetical protein U1Q18_020468, partial [Sarracenia purpurea var. burkii]